MLLLELLQCDALRFPARARPCPRTSPRLRVAQLSAERNVLVLVLVPLSRTSFVRTGVSSPPSLRTGVSSPRDRRATPVLPPAAAHAHLRPIPLAPWSYISRSRDALSLDPLSPDRKLGCKLRWRILPRRPAVVPPPSPHLARHGAVAPAPPQRAPTLVPSFVPSFVPSVVPSFVPSFVRGFQLGGARLAEQLGDGRARQRRGRERVPARGEQQMHLREGRGVSD